MLSTLHKIGMGNLAGPGVDPGKDKTYPLGDLSLTAYATTPAANNDERFLPNAAFVGQQVFIVNVHASNALVVKSSAPTPANVVELAADEAALCISTGITAKPWFAVILKPNIT